MKFYQIPKDKDAHLVWISCINRLDLRVGDLSKNTRLCSAHFHDGVKTADQPYPIKFSHKTCPLLCRGNPTRRLSSPGTGRKRRKADDCVHHVLDAKRKRYDQQLQNKEDQENNDQDSSQATQSCDSESHSTNEATVLSC